MRVYKLAAALLAASVSFATYTWAQDDDEDAAPDAGSIYGNIDIRLIGPAITSGRVTDFAVNPDRIQQMYVATASGGLWKTENNGVTWDEIFDGEGSYSIGVVEMDPNDAQTIWVGSGENNSQRAVAYGDGVYKSTDGGASWDNVGLATSEHIGQIVIDPRNSDRVFVAAHGPLWNAGGERGVYLTEDGGETWQAVLEIDEYTGANEMLMNADNNDLMLVSTYQRARHLWTLIDGGPGGGIHRSTDGGRTWSKVSSGLPRGDLGRIGLAAAPSSPNVVYAVIEAANTQGQGTYRSDDFGRTWSKVSSRISGSPQYYNELIVHPTNPETVYLMDTVISVSYDGGESWDRLSIANKHVDEHALWINPDNPDHMRTGNDGGAYETFDAGANWRFYGNLPITQFYRITADNDLPFYNVYGGTQDNNSLGAASRTIFDHGISNADWVFTWGGDGFETVVDPENADIIYSQSQYGFLGRVDRTTGERVFITPQPEAGEPNYRWNWNSPVLISPHNNERLYYAAEYVFRSDDQGNSWTKISPDLTRNINRNELEIMGRVWSVDAVAKNDSTSIWGSIIGLSESPIEEGLIIVGSDDGLIHITRNGGGDWDNVDGIRGVPEQSYVEDVLASSHDTNVMYAIWDNHKMGDFKPYVYKSENGGRSWSSIASNLPERGSAHTIVEDHIDPNLLFVGTEFGLYFTQDGGQNWHELKDLPTIAVRDLEIQQREGDLVVGTFGRGIYILDDYSPLRTSVDDVSSDDMTTYGVKDAWMYEVARLWSGGSEGDDHYTADNPDFGAIITYYMPEGLNTRRQRRHTEEGRLAKDGEDTPYPSWEELQVEDREESPGVILTIRDAAGNVVRRITGPSGKGLHRVAWDLHTAANTPVSLTPSQGGFFGSPEGRFVAEGNYTVSFEKRVEGAVTAMGSAQSFNVRRLGQGIFDAEDPASLIAFQDRTIDFRRAYMGAGRALDELNTRVDHLLVALRDATVASEDLNQQLRTIEANLDDITIALNGDRTRSSRNEQADMGITGRGFRIGFAHGSGFAEVSENFSASLDVASGELVDVLNDLRAADAGLGAIEGVLGSAGPWTPGTIPEYGNN